MMSGRILILTMLPVVLMGSAAPPSVPPLPDWEAAAPSRAQPPDEAWALPPGLSTAPPSEAQASAPSTPEDPKPPSTVRRPVYSWRPEDFNRISLYGAQALGPWERALALHLGFPFLGAKARLGVGSRVDVGVELQSLFGNMNELLLAARWQLFGDDQFAVSASLEAGRAFFLLKPAADPRGPRWLTGRRNWNLSPALQLSWRGPTPRSARIFVDLRYLAAIDTEPYQQDPLGGVPAAVQLGHNAGVRAGAEMPFSAKTSFLFLLGFDLHGRSVDSTFMPVLTVGVVTSL